MDTKALLANIKDSIEKTANSKAVYGDPVTEDGVTIIPVAKISIQGGGGGGNGPTSSKDGSLSEGSGMGFGMKIHTYPVGYIQIKNGQSVFVPIVDKNKLLVGSLILGGIALIILKKIVMKYLK